MVLFAFLTLIIMLCVATTTAVISTRRETSLLEKKQLARLAAMTNAPSAIPAVAKPSHE